MAIETKYQLIRNSIESGHITRLGQVFEYIPKTKLAAELGIHYDRIKKMVRDVGEFKVSELLYLARVIGIEEKKILELLTEQVLADKKKIKGK